MLRKAGEANAEYTRRITLERSRRASDADARSAKDQSASTTVGGDGGRRHERNTACRSKARTLQRGGRGSGLVSGLRKLSELGKVENKWVGRQHWTTGDRV